MLYNENLHEEEQHLIQQIAEQTERGKIGWELTEYNPLSFLNEDKIDRGFWFVFRAFKQVPKSTLILALLLELCGEYNHTGRSFLVALRLAITGFFDP